MSFTDRRTMVSISLTRNDVLALHSAIDMIYQNDTIAHKILRKVVDALPPESKVQRLYYDSINKTLLGRRLVRSNRDEMLTVSEITAIRFARHTCEIQGQNFSWLVHPDDWVEVEA